MKSKFTVLFLIVLALAGPALLAYQSLKPKVTLYLLQRGADKGRPDAQYELGRRYACGFGAPKDGSLAVGCFRKAAEQKYAPAQYELGLCYQNGLGVKKRRRQSRGTVRPGGGAGIRSGPARFGNLL